MNEIQLGKVIAERTLVNSSNGARTIVRIGAPCLFADGAGWYCPYEIIPNESKLRYAAGLDAIQALQLAMRKIGVDIQVLNERSGRAMEWNGEADLGFPVSP
jgi:hypothetical protein